MPLWFVEREKLKILPAAMTPVCPTVVHTFKWMPFFQPYFNVNLRFWLLFCQALIDPKSHGDNGEKHGCGQLEVSIKIQAS